MHELSVCLALVDQVQAIAREHRATSVVEIIVSLGPLSGVEPGLLRNAYPIAAAGTIAETARLVIDQSRLVVRCNACGSQSAVAPNRVVCETCGDYRTTIVSGDELILERLELATPVQAPVTPTP